MLELTRITSKKPSILSKRFRLDAEGRLTKASGGQLLEGVAERVSVTTVGELADIITGLSPAQALVYGVTGYERARILTKKAMECTKQNGGDPLVARDRAHFAFPDGPGVLMVDGDFPAGQEMTAKDFRETLYKVVPALRDAPHVLASSASSHIYQGEQCLRAGGGLRMLVAVKDARDIPRAGEVLHKRLWLGGYGQIEISKSGAMLPRTFVDAAVWQPERLDFCAGAYCEPPLEQRRPKPEVLNADADPLDTRTALPSLSLEEESEFDRVISEAKKAAKPEADQVKALWVEERIAEGLEGIEPGKQEAERERLRETYTQAVRHRTLLEGFEITLDDGQRVTVGDMLNEPERYHGRRCCDPLEPNYRGDRRVAFINVRAAGQPYIFSHAHGGVRYALSRAREIVTLVDGERAAGVRQCLDVLKRDGGFFERGGEIVTVSDRGEVSVRDHVDITFDCDSKIRFERFDARAKKEVPTDCKPKIGTGIISARKRGLPELKGITTAPTMDPATGRVIDTDGFDPETGLLAILSDIEGWKGVRPKPSDKDAERACETLWEPFRDFPYDGDVSRGVMLSALLTASVRALLPTAPGFAFVSPVAGSGKTLVAKCLAEIVGETPGLLPDTKGDEEIRKRLLAVLSQGKRIVIFDNVTGVLESSALCVVLTSEIFQDRILQISKTLSAPTRTLLVVTGNNVSLRGDLCRRVITCNIDPKIERPWTRKFELDPVTYCRDHRFELIAGALTILRAGLQCGPVMKDQTASFELWSDSVRRAVCFVAEKGFLDVADPVDSIIEAYEQDEETAGLSGVLEAWEAHFGGEPVTLKDVIKRACAQEGRELEPSLSEALIEVVGEVYNDGTSARRLGEWCKRVKGRIVDRRRLEFHGIYRGIRRWRMVAKS